MHHLIHQVIARKGNDVEVITPGVPVRVAIDRMNRRRIGSLLVVEDHRLVGIITERDLLVRVLAEGRDPATTPVEDVMTRDLVVVAPDDTAAEAMRLVTRHRCRHLPVVDDGEICGVVSAGDLTAWLVQDQQQTIDDLHAYITGR